MRLRGGREWLSLVVCVALTGCNAGGERRSTTPRPSTSALQPDSSLTTATGLPADERCQRLHASVARGFSAHIANAVDMVTSSSTGSSEKASTYIRTKLNDRAEKVETACRATPVSLGIFQRETEELTRRPLNLHRERQLVVAYGEWAKPLGAIAKVTDIGDKVALCETYDRGVHAYYTVHESTAAYGKNMWVDQTVRNDTNKPVVVNQGGVLWARGIHPSYRGEWDRRKNAWLYTWGGSSADSQVQVEPGTAETFRAGVVVGYLPMRPDGMIREARPDLWLFPAERDDSGVHCRIHAGRAP